MQKTSSTVKRLRDSQAQATRQVLVTAAVQRFVAQGFAATSLDEIAQDVGTTKGAIYHHFPDKKALFREVYETLSRELIEAVAKSPETASPMPDGALQAFVRHAGQRPYQAVLFKDGPSVLGAAVCREIDTQYSLGLIRQLIGVFAPPELNQSVGLDILARMLLSALVEAAQIIASAEDGADTVPRIQIVLNRVVQALISR